MHRIVIRPFIRRIAVLSIVVMCSPMCPARAGEEAAVVRVASGTLEGVAVSDVLSYRGIPYAAPPVGALRWMPPVAATAWSGVRNADDYGPSCEQASPPKRVPFGSRAETMSEDCLTLNVWAPAVRSSALPVMVWLHGGGNTNGTGSERYFDGTAFARDGIVLVTLNYRLGLFGFFAHPALRSGDPAANAVSSNFGLLDQIAALRWVKANIAAFGGDASNVTLFGESAGGEDAVLLASSAAADGLFARAIVESAGGLWAPFPSNAQAERRGAKIAEKLGLSNAPVTAAQLRALPAEKLAAIDDDDQIGIIHDGRVVAGPASAAFEELPRVPALVGTNDDDGSLVGDFADPTALFPGLPAARLASIRQAYAARGVTSDAAVARALFRDGFFVAPSRWVAARTAAAGHASYLYRFDYVASFLASRRPAATHGSEIPFVFETFESSLLSETDRHVEATIHGCWVAFAKTGVPLCPGTPTWSAYDAESGRTMFFDATPSLQKPDDSAVMDALQGALL